MQWYECSRASAPAADDVIQQTIDDRTFRRPSLGGASYVKPRPVRVPCQAVITYATDAGSQLWALASRTCGKRKCTALMSFRPRLVGRAPHFSCSSRAQKQFLCTKAAIDSYELTSNAFGHYRGENWLQIRRTIIDVYFQRPCVMFSEVSYNYQSQTCMIRNPRNNASANPTWHVSKLIVKSGSKFAYPSRNQWFYVSYLFANSLFLRA